MKANYIKPEKLKDVISRMKYENGLAIRVCLATGLRLSDVLAIKYAQISASNRITVKEQKTGKSRRVYLPKALHRELMGNAKHFWAFPHRSRTDRHRTRQTVYIDFKRAVERSGMPSEGMSPHGVRKTWAVAELARVGSLEAVRNTMNHTNAGITALYALSDKL